MLRLTMRVAVILIALSPTVFAADNDGDGLDDDFERQLALRFAPRFMVSAGDCDFLPSEFQAGVSEPRSIARNGTIYYRVFRNQPARKSGAFVEIHYFHLWSLDCGRMGHPLDVEHVSALVRASRADRPAADWEAEYWYASAHEDTVCDASHGAKAADIRAEKRGPDVWISSGKHASFLSLRLCGKNCGGDTCEQMAPMTPSKFINIGEPGSPLNGALWVTSDDWKMADKLKTDFGPDVIAQLDQPKKRGITKANDSTPPLQAVILAGGATADAVTTGNKHTEEALTTANEKTETALEKASDSVESSLKKATRAVGDFLGVKPKAGSAEK